MKNIIKKLVLVFVVILPFYSLTSWAVDKPSSIGLVEEVIDADPGYIIIEGKKFIVPSSARVSERYSKTPLRLRHVHPQMMVEYQLDRKKKGDFEILKSIEIIPQ